MFPLINVWKKLTGEAANTLIRWTERRSADIFLFCSRTKQCRF